MLIRSRRGEYALLKTFIQGLGPIVRMSSHGVRLSENQEDKLDWKSREYNRDAHLSENQEDKLVPLRMLHEGLYTCLQSRLLTTE